MQRAFAFPLSGVLKEIIGFACMFCVCDEMITGINHLSVCTGNSIAGNHWLFKRIVQIVEVVGLFYGALSRVIWSDENTAYMRIL